MASVTVQLQCTTTPHTTRFSQSPSTTSTPLDTHVHHTSHWHFPGPSSRFNQRERASTQSRANVTRAVTPNFSTERRAHRRAHSSYTVPTVRDTHERAGSVAARKTGSAHARFSLPHSPPSSDSGRSPLSRFGSFTMAGAGSDVVTPARKIRSSQYDSPYSDYFTDDNRSIDEIASQSLTASETQQLLLRLNKLQTTLLLGGNDSQALYLVGRRMSEIENDMDALHSQSRQPPELDDSGLFMEEDEAEEEPSEKKLADGLTLDGANEHVAAATIDHDTQTEAHEQQHDLETIVTANNISQTLQIAHQEMQKRFHEFSVQREQLEQLLREKDAELNALRTETEYMQQDLKLDHGDFVLLDGQLRLLENKLASTSDPVEANTRAIDAMRLDCRRAIDNVNITRMRFSQCRTTTSMNDQFDEVVKQGRWKMDVVRDPTGRVDLMALERRQCDDDDEVGLRAIPRIDIEEMTASIVRKADHVLYVDASTQCESQDLEQPWQDDEDYVSDQGYDPRSELRRRALDEDLYMSDCAITTSPPSECGGYTMNDDDDKAMKTDKGTVESDDNNTHNASAWHELWRSMADLAGVGDHRW